MKLGVIHVKKYVGDGVGFMTGMNRHVAKYVEDKDSYVCKSISIPSSIIKGKDIKEVIAIQRSYDSEVPDCIINGSVDFVYCNTHMSNVKGQTMIVGFNKPVKDIKYTPNKLEVITDDGIISVDY